MKWPYQLYLIRHGESAYNVLKARKQDDPLYAEFKRCFEVEPSSEKTRGLALAVKERFALKVSDSATQITDTGREQARETGKALKLRAHLPDVIFVSPYDRTLSTLEHMYEGWEELRSVPLRKDERLREQEHGLSLLYNDWRVFQTLYPEQRELMDLLGTYRYTYPQGEDVPDMRHRDQLWLTTLTRDFSGKRVFAIMHHLRMLATMANLESWGEQEFIEFDEHHKPSNAGVTLYQCDPGRGTDGKFVREYYNKTYY